MKTMHTILTIVSCGGANIGRCYNAQYYKITSKNRLSYESINGLWKMGLLGYGQEFHINSDCNGKEEPSHIDDTDRYYVYNTEARVDSSD